LIEEALDDDSITSARAGIAAKAHTACGRTIVHAKRFVPQSGPRKDGRNTGGAEAAENLLKHLGGSIAAARHARNGRRLLSGGHPAFVAELRFGVPRRLMCSKHLFNRLAHRRTAPLIIQGRAHACNANFLPLDLVSHEAEQLGALRDKRSYGLRYRGAAR